MKNRLIIANILFWIGIIAWEIWLFEFIQYGFLTIATMFFSLITFCIFFYGQEPTQEIKDTDGK